MGSINAAVTMRAGEYREINVLVENTLGEALDLTGVHVIKWALALNELSPPILEKSYPASGIRLDAPGNGVFTVVLSGVDTSGLSGGVYYQEAIYDLRGKTVNAVVGTLRIRPTII